MTKTSAAPPDFNLGIQSSEIILQMSVPHYTAAGGLFHLVHFCSLGVPLISNLALAFCPCPWKAEDCDVPVMLLMALLCQAPLKLRTLKGIAGQFTFTVAGFIFLWFKMKDACFKPSFLLQTFFSK